jgi:peptide/histidine transporter 3/4
MGVGVVLSVVAMLIAGVVEQRRRELAVLQAEANREPLSGTLVSPASAFWLAPQLAALGLSEAFKCSTEPDGLLLQAVPGQRT